MRVDDENDVLRRDPYLRQSIFERRAPIGPGIFDPIDVEKLGVLFISSPRIDEHRPNGVLDQKAAHAEGYTIARVGSDSAFPEWLRDYTKHRPPIEPLYPSLDGMNAK